MFADSLLDSGYPQGHRRVWTTAASFGMQALAVGILLVLPMIYVEAIPALHLIDGSLALPVPPPAPGPAAPRTHANASNLAQDGRILQPPSIPDHVADVDDQNVPPTPDGIGVPQGTGPAGVDNSVLHSIFSSRAIIPALPLATIHPPARVSRVMEGNLIHRVQPSYPPLARQARIQGEVVLRAVISREGLIENLQVASGHPMLVPAAIEAVRQWRYKPYSLNGEPVEVETQITVNFVLSGG